MTPTLIAPGTPAPRADVAAVDVNALRRGLEREIEGEVRFDKVSRALYSTDASVYRIEPLGVVIPRSREDVVRTVRLCHRFRCPLTLRGGGTSQAGQSINHGLQLDTSKYFNRLLELNAAERWVRVEPGIVLDELNAVLEPWGLRFPIDISSASRATLGGMIANNSSGARSVLYGLTADHVLELEVVLSDGSVSRLRPLAPEELDAACQGETLEAGAYRTVRRLAEECREEAERRYPKILRRVGGYNLEAFTRPGAPFDLTKLITGSEGTLAVVVEARLRVTPLPKAKAVLAVSFAELLEGLAATPVILGHGPSAVEVMDKFILDHTRGHPAFEAQRKEFIAGDPGAILCVEFYAERAEDLPPRLETLERDLAARGFRCDCQWVTEDAAQTRLWKLREAALGLSTAMRGDAKSVSFVEDTAVAPEKLRDYIERFLEVVHRHGTRAGVYAHASVGCLHVRPVVNLKTEEGVRQFEAIATEISDLVLEFGGALSGEHGDGMVRSPFQLKMFGPVLYEAFREVKRAFDPLGILNPGRIVDSPPLTSHLRYGPAYRTPDPPAWFDYSDYGGLGRAVEMCSGVGACRKKLSGTMCPSFMATLEEAHSTRGRANVLRLAMSGDIGEAGLGDRGVFEVMKLCLECRACKDECPTGVDMARFKSEFLADYWRRHGVPLRARLFGHIHEVSRMAARAAPLANLLAGSAAARWLGEKLLGIDRRRRLPDWQGETFAQRFAGRRGGGEGAVVTLFNDTFTNYYYPEIGMAAVRMLEAAGRRVELAGNGCCGRPLISQGLLAQARERAGVNAERLYPAAASGRRILFCEPSCLSAVREDAPDLLRGELREKARAVARASMLLEEYLESECAAGRASLRLARGPSRIVLHGHCHQKAMGLVGATAALLSRIPDCAVERLDAGCCGMAGSFGYLHDNYDLSHRIAARRLLPAAGELREGAVLVAAGVSCRQQVEHFAGVRPFHPAELLASLLAV